MNFENSNLSFYSKLTELICCCGFFYSVGDCGVPPPVENGKSKKCGDAVSYYCDEGFSLEGASELMCENGRFTPAAPRCVGESPRHSREQARTIAFDGNCCRHFGDEIAKNIKSRDRLTNKLPQ